MILKDHDKPIKLWKYESINSRIVHGHTNQLPIQDAVRIIRAGDRGERSLDYYVNLIDHERTCCIHDLRLPWRDYYFQMDTLLLNPAWMLIVEVKNMVGDIYFNQDTKQMLRTIEDYTEPFPDPLLQVQKHQF
ncbi:nuclease-related domain-containing protein [Alkalibacillus aidingensis]|uniref:nuclease-related domain-containing protein n=1 Tax=Alkalibacillus aidingensis TaxID=2747607 RepID=UPI001660125B|nr:nuclease-related domain-containing protein [Alkalibacillus aidingensis]